ncbi:winged-helix domain protein [Halophage HF1]|uniref:Winged-helix domain protein n=2 Tax=Haloferacalesvirus TaxID=2843389 RepID=Q8V6N9_9CAUD|nr:winged-helix domain protein [Halorubrum phage HF2]NP_861651.1 winged-helix domain protein [Halophage HF1]AAL54985.1 winged-helix domain protein [Halorubrum phage HF2]AAO61362.1 winged-helix domain protein [Halophage HF1]QIR31084.1 winged-helix DNA-binding domain protein [Halorubrum virus Hardycor2]
MASEEPDGVLTLELSGDDGLQAFNRFIEETGFSDTVNSIKVTIEADSPIDLTEYITGSEIEKRESDPPDVVTFEDGSRTRKLAEFLYEYNGDGWYTTNEIRDSLTEDCGIDPDDVSQILWELSERDVVEKRPFDGDGRKKEYRLNELGFRSVEAL